MKRIRRDTPEKAAARLERFLASPPARISADKVAQRRQKEVRRTKTRNLLEEMCEVQGWRCGYCRRSMRRKPDPQHPYRTATVDHRLPVSRGGTNARANLIAACSGCNTDKGSMTEEEYRAAKQRPA